MDTSIEERVVSIRKDFESEDKYLVGPDYVKFRYEQSYPKDEPPTLWYIQKVVKKHGLQTRKPHPKKVKGGSEYLLYPKQSVYNLGDIHQSGDFIGKKYITGVSKPVNTFSTSYYAPFKLVKFVPIPAEKTNYVVPILSDMWQTIPIPDVFRIDNGAQFRGSTRGKRFLSRFLKFLLNLDITPLFGAQYMSWTNPHIEGHNRVFTEKIWNQN